MFRIAATADQLAAHDKDAWRELDTTSMLGFGTTMAVGGFAPYATTDGVAICPLASRRIWKCGHYYSFSEMTMNAHEPLPDGDNGRLASKCETCRLARASEATEDRLVACFEEC